MRFTRKSYPFLLLHITCFHSPFGGSQHIGPDQPAHNIQCRTQPPVQTNLNGRQNDMAQRRKNKNVEHISRILSSVFSILASDNLRGHDPVPA